MSAGSFTAEIAAIRKRAKQKMEDGPVTGSYGEYPEEKRADDIADLLFL